MFGGLVLGIFSGDIWTVFGRMFGDVRVIVWLCFGDAQGCFGDVSGYSFDASIILRLF